MQHKKPDEKWKLLWEFKIMSHYDISEGWCNDRKEMGRNIFGSEIEVSTLQQRGNGGWELRGLRGLINGVATHTWIVVVVPYVSKPNLGSPCRWSMSFTDSAAKSFFSSILSRGAVWFICSDSIAIWSPDWRK